MCIRDRNTLYMDGDWGDGYVILPTDNDYKCEIDSEGIVVYDGTRWKLVCHHSSETLPVCREREDRISNFTNPKKSICTSMTLTQKLIYDQISKLRKQYVYFCMRIRLWSKIGVIGLLYGNLHWWYTQNAPLHSAAQCASVDQCSNYLTRKGQTLEEISCCYYGLIEINWSSSPYFIKYKAVELFFLL